MKVTPSPLVAGLSGTSAGAVAASWKGRQYVRKHVVPKNPNTAAQQAVRTAFSGCVTLWRSLSNKMKDWLDSYGTAQRMSGYNVFMARNRALMQAGDPLVPVPANPNVPACAITLSVDGVSSGQLKATWTDPANADFTKIAFALLKDGDEAFVAVSEDTLTSAATKTFTGLTAGATYRVYAFLYNSTTGEFGTVDSAELAAKS